MQQVKIPYTYEEKKNAVILFVLYTIQGLPMGFFSAVQILLAERGATMSEQSELSLVFLPFTFKFLTAPFLDIYYNNRFGQRKTYIVPIQYLMMLFFVYLSNNIEELVDTKNVGTLTIYGFTAIFLAAQQDVAVDGIGLKMMEEHHVSLTFTLNATGQLFGMLLSSNLLLMLTSQRQCQNYFSIEQCPLVSIPTFLRICALGIAIVTLYIHFFLREKAFESKQAPGETPSLLHIFKCLRGFYYNKRLLKTLFMFLTYRLGIFGVVSAFGTTLVKQGFRKETLAELDLLLVAVPFVASYIANKYSLQDNEIKLMRATTFAYIFCGAFLWLLLVWQQQYNSISNIAVFFAIMFIKFLDAFTLVNQGCFITRRCDVDLGASSLTILYSFANLGGQGSISINLWLIGRFGFTAVNTAGWSYTVLYWLVFAKMYNALQICDKKDFKLNAIYNTDSREKNI